MSLNDQEVPREFQKMEDKKKFWMFVNVTARRLLEGIFISSSMMIFWAVMTGTGIAIVFVAVSLLSLLLRVWIWSRDMNKYGAVPEYDHYRLYMIEKNLKELKEQGA